MVKVKLLKFHKYTREISSLSLAPAAILYIVPRRANYHHYLATTDNERIPSGCSFHVIL